ncbi:MAG: hypothetical protein HKN47_22900 [Pirellulaceae bacterium]|nr:hypothetical protein [Pirellulaceae bacterium]
MKFVVAAGLIWVTTSITLAESPQSDASAELKKVQARSIELAVPKNWEEVKTTSSMRAAQFRIPASAEGTETADLVVFYFGGPTGGVKANVERWLGQFDEKDRQIEMFQGECRAGSYILVDVIGTWNKPDGPPFAQKTIATPNSRVVNVIVIEENDDAKDYYFLKLSGDKRSVSKQTDALRQAIGAKPETEKPFAIKDAPN